MKTEIKINVLRRIVCFLICYGLCQMWFLGHPIIGAVMVFVGKWLDFEIEA